MLGHCPLSVTHCLQLLLKEAVLRLNLEKVVQSHQFVVTVRCVHVCACVCVCVYHYWCWICVFCVCVVSMTSSVPRSTSPSMFRLTHRVVSSSNVSDRRKWIQSAQESQQAALQLCVLLVSQSCSCLKILRVLQKNGYLPNDASLFTEYARWALWGHRTPQEVTV